MTSVGKSLTSDLRCPSGSSSGGVGAGSGGRVEGRSGGGAVGVTSLRTGSGAGGGGLSSRGGAAERVGAVAVGGVSGGDVSPGSVPAPGSLATLGPRSAFSSDASTSRAAARAGIRASGGSPSLRSQRRTVEPVRPTFSPNSARVRPNAARRRRITSAGEALESTIVGWTGYRPTLGSPAALDCTRQGRGAT